MAEKNTLKQQIKEELLEDFGRFMEADSKVPPLAARMLAHLIIDNHKAITYEVMVDLLKPSKSAVFTNLIILLHKGRIIYYNLPGDPKKYHNVDTNHSIDHRDKRTKKRTRKYTI